MIYRYIQTFLNKNKPYIFLQYQLHTLLRSTGIYTKGLPQKLKNGKYTKLFRYKIILTTTYCRS